MKDKEKKKEDMSDPGKKKDKKPLKKVLREWAESFIVAFILAITIKYFFFEIYKIPTSSMEPTLIGKRVGGDRIIVNKVKYRFRDPKRWEVFVFHSPARDSNKSYIKRVTGMPGEKIVVINGDIYVNDKTVPEERPRVVQDEVYIKHENMDFSDDGWQYRFKPDNVTVKRVALNKDDQVLSISAKGKGKLKYSRPITNFYLRKGSSQIACIHRQHRGKRGVFFAPEASTLNSVIDCPDPNCDRKTDLFTLKNIYNKNKNMFLRIDLFQESSEFPGRFIPSKAGFAYNCPVGDMKISFKLRCRACRGYTGCLIRENNKEYIFIITSKESKRESRLVIKEYLSGKVLTVDKIDFNIFNGFQGTLAFENCNNRASFYVDGERVFSKVYNWGRNTGEVIRKSGFTLIFNDFQGAIDDFELYRDMYYTNTFDKYDGGIEDAQYAVFPDQPFQLGENEYFAMGDNSSNSRDSRYFGPVERDLIMGNAIMVFPWFNSKRWKLVK